MWFFAVTFLFFGHIRPSPWSFDEPAPGEPESPTFRPVIIAYFGGGPRNFLCFTFRHSAFLHCGVRWGRALWPCTKGEKQLPRQLDVCTMGATTWISAPCYTPHVTPSHVAPPEMTLAKMPKMHTNSAIFLHPLTWYLATVTQKVEFLQG